MAASKLKKNKTFWERKNEAFRNFGKAETRPQENFKKYLLSKRKLNLGFREIVDQKYSNGTSYPSLNVHHGASVPSPLPYEKDIWKIVETEEGFKKLMDHIKSKNEVTVDLEENKDHSYHGMVCWIQLGTDETTYLLDPFPLYEKIITDLKSYMESSEHLKIMHGSVNDMFAFRRDFGIMPSGVIDVQLIHREMMNIFFNQARNLNDEYFDDNGIIERATGIKPGSVPDSKDLDRLRKSTKEGIALSNLVKKYFPGSHDPPDATFADWRIRPLLDQRMIDYAVYDAHALFHVWQQLKKLVRLDIRMYVTIFWNQLVGIMKFTLKVTKRPVYKISVSKGMEESQKLFGKPVPLRDPTTDIVDFWKGNKPENAEIMVALYEFRNLHAKIIDEPPNEVLTTQEIVKICVKKPASLEELSSVIQKSRKSLPESINTWNRTALRIVQQGPSFWKDLKDRRDCHVCQGKYDYGHLAWGCVEDYSSRAVASFMNKPKNKQFKERENARRLKNWKQKHGDAPCPYLKDY